MERRRARTRQALLDAGVVVIADRGIDRLTIASITDEADVALGSFYNHFENRDDFLSQLSNDAIALWFDDARRLRPRVPVDQGERMAGACIVVARRGATDPTWARFVTESLARRDIPATSELRNLLAFGVRAGIEEGTFRCDHVDLVAGMILGAIRQVLVQLAEGHSVDDASVALARTVLTMCCMEREPAAEAVDYLVEHIAIEI